MRDHGFCCQKCTGHIELHDVLEEFLVHLGQRFASNEPTNYINENINRVAESFASLGHQVIDVSLLRHVALYSDGFTTCFLDRGDGRLTFSRVVEVVDDDFRPVGSNCLGYRPPDIAGPAGYDGNLVFHAHYIFLH